MIPRDLFDLFRSTERLILADLEELVVLESPSDDRLALEALKGVLIDRLRCSRPRFDTEHANALRRPHHRSI